MKKIIFRGSKNVINSIRFTDPSIVGNCCGIKLSIPTKDPEFAEVQGYVLGIERTLLENSLY